MRGIVDIPDPEARTASGKVPLENVQSLELGTWGETNINLAKQILQDEACSPKVNS